MENIKKNFGFGAMRLPMQDGEVDIPQTCRMVDAFLDAGFNYFDTAHGYLDGKSELALRECLTSRYPRDRYILTDKLTNFYFKQQEDIRPFFQSQLEVCGVDYFDFYLMHAQSMENFSMFKRCHAYETALELKAEGKIRHFGISFHDRAAVLEQILTEYPQIEVVQIQFNYVDYEDPAVESRKCYEVCRRFGKPVIVMEPVKGGNLAKLPEKAAEILDALHGGSPASYAIRFAAGFEGMMMVLSGMSSLEQVEENIRFMQDFQPLNDRELEAIGKVREVFRSMHLIPCTACRYCVEGCPQNISIPDLFAVMNTKQIYHDWNADYYYNEVHTKQGGKASSCVKCGKCEKACPQHLPIRELLEKTAQEFEQKV
ncbi:aldo/keto reductase [uncultured Oscillibacter sp.]|uniref:aldo/keto reductase n=1 Tax=uncultured Oscillibacter sp. TaxID=876091 RepID=UPI0025FD5402|nr:aldo/keto reductase [uncultured Oscillibacter sp.]